MVQNIKTRKNEHRKWTTHSSDNANWCKWFWSLTDIWDLAHTRWSGISKIHYAWNRIGEEQYRPEITNTWVHHHDNAPRHASVIVRAFLEKQTLATLPQPLYNPDLAAGYFFLPWAKSRLKGHHLGTVKTWKLPLRMLWKRSVFKTSRSVTTSGRTSGNGVLNWWSRMLFRGILSVCKHILK